MSIAKCWRRGSSTICLGIERRDWKFAPGPAGLKLSNIFGEGGENPGYTDIGNLAAAEPGIKALKNSRVLYSDGNGTPAFISSRFGKGITIYLNSVVTDYHRWRLKPPEGEAIRN